MNCRVHRPVQIGGMEVARLTNRNHDPTPEPFVTKHIASSEGEQTYIYPKKDQNPTAVYDGLRALLPHVSMDSPAVQSKHWRRGGCIGECGRELTGRT